MRSALWPDEDAEELAREAETFLSGGLTRGPALQAVFVAQGAGGEIVGFLELAVREYAEGCSGPTPFVEGWFVEEGARGGGVGAALVREAEGWARGRGFRELGSDALIDNLGSLAAHVALGFEEVERIVCFRKSLD